MKKIICFVLAVIMVAAVFAGCAKKAEMKTVDALKIKTVTAVAANRELDSDAFAKAFNAATPGNIVDDDDKDYTSNDLMLVVMTDGIIEVFETGENKFVVHSALFDYTFEIESEELYQLFKAA